VVASKNESYEPTEDSRTDSSSEDPWGGGPGEEKIEEGDGAKPAVELGERRASGRASGRGRSGADMVSKLKLLNILTAM
jgi:hypothetical protein